MITNKIKVYYYLPRLVKYGDTGFLSFTWDETGYYMNASSDVVKKWMDDYFPGEEFQVVDWELETPIK